MARPKTSERAQRIREQLVAEFRKTKGAVSPKVQKLLAKLGELENNPLDTELEERRYAAGYSAYTQRKGKAPAGYAHYSPAYQAGWEDAKADQKENPVAKSKKPAKRGKRKAARPRVPVGIPPKKKAESWVGYHDRLTALAMEADQSGDHELATALFSKAGRIAGLRSRVRDQPRKGKRKGPGSYPWKECIRQTEGRLKRKFPGDYRERAKKVCGAIRAGSQRRYAAYWKARDPGRALPGPRPNPELRPDELATDTESAWLDHKGMQYIAGVEVRETIVAIVREKPGSKGEVLGGDVLISRGYESPHQALCAAKSKIDELAKMRRSRRRKAA